MRPFALAVTEQARLIDEAFRNPASATEREHTDALLDELLNESFPASDSRSISSATTAFQDTHPGHQDDRPARPH